MLDYEKHRNMREYVAALNRFYLEHSELWFYDFSAMGFEWLLADEKEKNLILFKRKSDKSSLIILLSFSGIAQSVRIRLENEHLPKLLFATEDIAEPKKEDLQKDSSGAFLDLTVPAFFGGIFTDETQKTIKI